MVGQLPLLDDAFGLYLATSPDRKSANRPCKSAVALPSLGKATSVAVLPVLSNGLLTDAVGRHSSDSRRQPRWRSAERSLAAAELDTSAKNSPDMPTRKRDLRKQFRESRMGVQPSQKRSMARLAPLPPAEDAPQHWANERLKMVRGTHRIEGGIHDCTRIRRELVGLREQMVQSLEGTTGEGDDQSGELIGRLEKAISDKKSFKLALASQRLVGEPDLF